MDIRKLTSLVFVIDFSWKISVSSVILLYQLFLILYIQKRTLQQEDKECWTWNLYPIGFFCSRWWRYRIFNFPSSSCLQNSSQKDERYEDVVNFIRSKLSFLILRSALTCIRGSRPYDKDSVMVDGFSLACDSDGIRWVGKTLHTQALFFHYVRSVSHSQFFHTFCFQSRFASECQYLP